MRKLSFAVIVLWAATSFAEKNAKGVSSPSPQEVIKELAAPIVPDELNDKDIAAATALMAQDAEASAVAAKANAPVAKETEIPVILEDKKIAAAESSPITKVTASLAGILILAAGFFFVIRKYAKRGTSLDKATQIKVLTQHYLGPKKSLAIVRVAGESILIGVTDHSINLIKPLSLLDEDIPEDVPKGFASTLNAKAIDQDFDEEEFAISGLKEVVKNKLKSMRTIG